jgi:type I restriction enzyme S subunit
MSVPKLRFPDFRDAGEWEIKEFSKYIVLYRGSSPRPIQNYLSIDSSGVNWIKIGDTKSAKNFVISQVEEKITPEGAKKSRKVNVGELILANSMSYGKTYQVAIDGYIYDGWFVLRDYEKYFDKQFLLQLLNSEYMQSQYERFSAGGIVQNISSDIVYKTVLPHTLLKEQKKIADCLSSIDDRITLETQKLDTLKAHKKGLMQQLFPVEGETLPKLRFPEFRDAGEWEERKLGELANFSSGGTPSKDISEYWNGNIPWISASSMYELNIWKSDLSITELGLKAGSRIAKKGSLLILVRGSMLHKRIPLGIALIDVAFNQDIKALSFIGTNINKCFLLYQLIAMEAQLLDMVSATGLGAGKLDTNELKQILVYIPNFPEQQKIADCLSSIDEAISLQSQAIDLLKLHKKGLMQQLFPSVEEVKR